MAAYHTKWNRTTYPSHRGCSAQPGAATNSVSSKSIENFDGQQKNQPFFFVYRRRYNGWIQEFGSVPGFQIRRHTVKQSALLCHEILQHLAKWKGIRTPF